ncbi:MAG: metallophosphoesterase [Chloroflexota bacterium]
MTLIIGDIHGCYNELQALLDKAGIADDEPIYAIGDILDRGPAPEAVLDFFLMHPHAHSIRGNHEQRHIRYAKGKGKPRLTQIITRWVLDERYHDALDYMRQMPLMVELDEARLIHGYYDPQVAPKDQRKNVLLGTKKGEKYIKKQLDVAWFSEYNEDKPLICGHKDYSRMERPFVLEGQVYGLDTRCVHGGMLTGLRLPQWEIICVPSKKNYWKRIRKKYKRL